MTWVVGEELRKALLQSAANVAADEWDAPLTTEESAFNSSLHPRSRTGQWAAKNGQQPPPKHKKHHKHQKGKAKHGPKAHIEGWYGGRPVWIETPPGPKPKLPKPKPALPAAPPPEGPLIGPVASLFGDHLHVVDGTDPQVRLWMQQIELLPPGTVKALVDGGIQVYVGGRPAAQLDDLGYLADTPARGWPAGTTLGTLDGFFEPTKKIVAIGDGGATPPPWAALHEIGHAFASLAGTDTSPECQQFFTALHDKLTPYEQQSIQEFYADLFALSLYAPKQAVAAYGQDAVNWVRAGMPS